MLRKLNHRWIKWKDWCEFSKEKYGPVKRFLIFLGIIHNEWFEQFVNWNNSVAIEKSTSGVCSMTVPIFPLDLSERDMENMENIEQ